MRRSQALAAALKVGSRALRELRVASRARLLLAAFLGVLIGGSAAWWGFPPAAHAASCQQVGWNTVASNDTNSFNHYGTRVTNPGMRAFSGGTICTRVSSILAVALDPVNDNAEVGWATTASGAASCGTTGDGKMHVFYAGVISGAPFCHQVNSIVLSNGGDYSFSVRFDFNNQTHLAWIFDFNGNVLAEINENFSASTSTTNGERHILSASESAQSLFDGMQFRTSSNTWSAWGHSACWDGPDGLSNDPDYNNQLLSNTKVQVTEQAPQC